MAHSVYESRDRWRLQTTKRKPPITCQSQCQHPGPHGPHTREPKCSEPTDSFASPTPQRVCVRLLQADSESDIDRGRQLRLFGGVAGIRGWTKFRQLEESV